MGIDTNYLWKQELTKKDYCLKTKQEKIDFEIKDLSLIKPLLFWSKVLLTSHFSQGSECSGPEKDGGEMSGREDLLFLIPELAMHLFLTLVFKDRKGTTRNSNHVSFRTF